MTEYIGPNLFAAAGLVLDAEPTPPKPKRPRKPAPPTPNERAAAGRLEGARRSRGPMSPGQRARVGGPRSLSPAPVVAFPLDRNAQVLSDTVQSLPHFYDEAFEKKWVKIGRNVERRLIRRGLAPD